MSLVKVQGNASGTGIFTIAAPNSNTDTTFTLPTTSGTVLTNAGPFTASSSASNGAVTIDASNNVGVGTSSPGAKLDVSGTIRSSGSNGIVTLLNGNTSGGMKIGVYTAAGTANGYLAFEGYSAEYGRFDSNGNLLVGTTNADPTFNRVNGNVVRQSGGILLRSATAGSDFGINVTSGTHITFFTDNGSARVSAGNIASNGNVTSYNTGSDYRLKEDVVPMLGALSKIAALKPVTYKWIDNKAQGEGFLAHELAEVIPLAVTGEKDAVKEDGSPDIQSVDYSKIVVHLVAAIQELGAKVEAQAAEIAALKGAA